MSNSLVLVGLPGSGKTFWGKQIASYLGISFYDLDQLIENETNMTIHEIFEEGSEKLFRKIEHSILRDICINSSGQKIILAVGGGTPAYYNNMNVINQFGKSIYLNIPTLQIAHRLHSDSNQNRPLVKSSDIESLKLYLDKLKVEREPYYLLADHMLNDNELSIANFIKVLNDKI